MKKFISWSLLLVMLLSLSGCGTVIKNELEQNESKSSQDIDENQSIENDQTAKEDTSKQEAPIEEKQASEPVANKKVVVIDPGHSSHGNKGVEKLSPDSDVMKIKDPGGAQGDFTGTPEYVVAMSVALKLKSLLEQNQVTVIMTKTQDSDSPGNIERAEVGNSNNANLEIRIHCDSADSSSANGASMLVPQHIGYAKDISGISEKYGQTILDSLVADAGMKNRGVVKRDDLTGFNWSKVPVVLVEMGFMSNPQEDKLLNDDSYQNKLAQGLCDGILESLK